MAEEYKLTYFNSGGLCEPIRLCFAYSGIQFEDERIEKKGEEWKKIASENPWNTLPFLTINGEKKLGQSSSICRFVAKKCSLLPKDEFDQAKADEYTDAFNDLRKEWNKYYFEEDETEKEEKLLRLNNLIIRYFEQFVQVLDENTESEWLIGKELSWADFFIAHYLEIFEVGFEPSVLEEFPKLKAYKESVFKLPQLKTYLESRPKTII